jgi:hypothetical protein
MRLSFLLLLVLSAQIAFAQQHGVVPPDNANKPAGRIKAPAKPSAPIADIDKFPQEWQPIVTTNTDTIFYQPASVTETPLRTITFWTKAVPKDLASARKRKVASLAQSDPELAPKYLNYAYDLEWMEIRCSTNEFRLLDYFDYATNGDVLDSVKNRDPQWGVIVPTSAIDKVREKLCINNDPLGIDQFLRENPQPAVSPGVDELSQVSERVKSANQPKRKHRTKKP